MWPSGMLHQAEPVAVLGETTERAKNGEAWNTTGRTLAETTEEAEHGMLGVGMVIVHAVCKRVGMYVLVRVYVVHHMPRLHNPRFLEFHVTSRNTYSVLSLRVTPL